MAKKDTSWHVYILECGDGSYYVGLTEDLERRLEEHQAGFGAQYTHVRLPVVLRYKEVYSNRRIAEGRELQLKGWTRAKKQALIEGRRNKLRQLSRGQS